MSIATTRARDEPLAIAPRSWHKHAMGDPVRALSVYERFRAVPAHLVAEVIRGALITQPRPAARHAHAASVLEIDLGAPFHRGRGGPGGWIILVEPELHLDGNILVPDLAGWRRTRMPELPDVAAFDLAPDWVCEVVSPSTEAIDRTDKLPIYAASGVAHAWIVNPLAQTLEAYKRDAERWVLLGTFRDAALVRAEPFDAVELELGALWAR
jgi:Uma2 family endonuclease